MGVDPGADGVQLWKVINYDDMIFASFCPIGVHIFDLNLRNSFRNSQLDIRDLY